MGDPIKKAKRILRSKIYKNRVAKGKSTPRADRVFDKADAALKATPTMKKGGAKKSTAKKKFKAHMMYSKSGKAVRAGTMKKHLELKAKGYNHDKRRLKKKK